jgi:hypothetical protein
MLAMGAGNTGFTLGYTKPHSYDLGFEGRHEAAYMIQMQFRSFTSKKSVARALVTARETAFARKEKPIAPPVDLSLLDPMDRRRRQVWMVCNDPSSSWLAWLLAIVMLLLILCSCTMFVLETLPTFYGRFGDEFLAVEFVCVISFTIEFICRVCSCPSPRIFARDVMNWVDFASIVPFYIELWFSSNQAAGLATLRLIRLARVFRLFKLGRHSSGLQVFAGTLRQSVRPMLTLIMFVICGVVIIASIM